jgi:hypothetical protein
MKEDDENGDEEFDEFLFNICLIQNFTSPNFFQENRRVRTVQRKRNLILQKPNQLKHHPKEVCIHDCCNCLP